MAGVGQTIVNNANTLYSEMTSFNHLTVAGVGQTCTNACVNGCSSCVFQSPYGGRGRSDLEKCLREDIQLLVSITLRWQG